MAKCLDDLLTMQEGKQEQDLTKLEDFKEYLTNLEDENYSILLDKIVANIVSTIETVSAQNNHLNYYINEKIKRGFADKSDRKELLKELKQSAKEVKENVKWSKYPQGERELTDFIDDSPTPVSLKIPEGYIVNKEHGIYKMTINNDEPYNVQVYPSIVLPCELVKDENSTSKDKLIRLVKWNQVEERWEYHPYPVPLGKLTTSREITCLDGVGVIVVGDKYRKELANFFTELAQLNNGLKVLPKNEAVSRCGWTSSGEFFPISTKDMGDKLIVTTEVGTTADDIYEAMQQHPRGSFEEAKKLVEELRDNPVFAVMLAGALSAPLIPKLEGILDENIGIDLYGKTTAGKTTIQVLAINIVYGIGDMVKGTWAKARVAGVWRKVEELNNLPILYDDNHVISEHNAGIPHDLINGREGDKSQKSGDGWRSKSNSKNQYSGTILTNGEVSISSMSPDQTAGIHGRFIQINHPPFPSHYNHTKVENLKRTSILNGGHFAEDWIEFLKNVDINEVLEHIREYEQAFTQEDADPLYERLTTKATILVYCLEQFNKLFNMNVNVDKAIELLKQSMTTATNNVNVADKIVKRIVETVFQDIVHYQAQGTNEAIMYNHFPADKNNKINVVYKEGEYLTITLKVLEDILKDTTHTVKTARSSLASADYIESPKPKNHSRPKQPLEQNKAHISGFKFKYEDIKDFIPEEADYDEADDITVATPDMPFII